MYLRYVPADVCAMFYSHFSNYRQLSDLKAGVEVGVGVEMRVGVGGCFKSVCVQDTDVQ